MNGLPVGRLLGFEIRIHLSWVLILGVVAVLVVGQLEQTAPEVSSEVRWIVAAIIAAAFLGSVLAHELGHGIVARRRGLRPGPITLYFFGGSAAVEAEPNRPSDEAAVAFAGPAVSLTLGVLLSGVGVVLQEVSEATVRAVGAVSLILGALNVLLGTVNLVPGFPLDGGRLVRAAVWARTGDERRGARAAAMSGRLVGWGLVGAGLVVGLTGDTIDGLMLALSGWFLASAARAVDRRIAVEDLLRGVTIGEAMERDLPAIPPQLTLDTFADRFFGEAGVSTLPVVRDEEVLGVISPSQLKNVGKGAWTTTRAEELMVTLADLEVLAPSESVWSGLDRLRRTGLDGLPVIDASGLLGVLTRRSVIKAIQSQAALRGESVP